MVLESPSRRTLFNQRSRVRMGCDDPLSPRKVRGSHVVMGGFGIAVLISIGGVPTGLFGSAATLQEMRHRPSFSEQRAVGSLIGIPNTENFIILKGRDGAIDVYIGMQRDAPVASIALECEECSVTRIFAAASSSGPLSGENHLMPIGLVFEIFSPSLREYHVFSGYTQADFSSKRADYDISRRFAVSRLLSRRGRGEQHGMIGLNVVGERLTVTLQDFGIYTTFGEPVGQVYTFADRPGLTKSGKLFRGYLQDGGYEAVKSEELPLVSGTIAKSDE